MPRLFRRVALGGTFDRLHVGHDALFATAFASGREVVIGVTSDRYLALHPKAAAGRLRPYRARARSLRTYLARRYPGRRWAIVPIDDRFGGAVEPRIDALVVSAETEAGGRAVNAERRRRGHAPIPLLVVPLVLAQDLEPVSSTRVRAGTIDPTGARRTPVTVKVVAESAPDLRAVARGLRSALPSARLSSEAARRATASRAPPRRRAERWAQDAVRAAELGVGVARAGEGRWFVSLRSRRLALAPREVRGAGEATLARAVREMLRPTRKKAI